MTRHLCITIRPRDRHGCQNWIFGSTGAVCPRRCFITRSIFVVSLHAYCIIPSTNTVEVRMCYKNINLGYIDHRLYNSVTAAWSCHSWITVPKLAKHVLHVLQVLEHRNCIWKLLLLQYNIKYSYEFSALIADRTTL